MRLGFSLFITLISMSALASGPATTLDIQALSQRLAPGQYSGRNSDDAVCLVSVTSNADSSQYQVDISPAKMRRSGESGVASFAISTSTDYSAVPEDGFYSMDRFGESADLVFQSEGEEYQVNLILTLRAGNETTVGDCTIHSNGKNF